MEYDSALTNELRTVVIHSRSVYNQTILANYSYTPEFKSKNPRGLNEVSLPLARMEPSGVNNLGALLSYKCNTIMNHPNKNHWQRKKIQNKNSSIKP